MKCQHCHQPIDRHHSWQQIYHHNRFIDLCSLVCVAAYLDTQDQVAA